MRRFSGGAHASSPPHPANAKISVIPNTNPSHGGFKVQECELIDAKKLYNLMWA